MTLNSRPYFAVGKSSTWIGTDDQEARAGFASHCGFVCKQGLAIPFLEIIQVLCARAQFIPDPAYDVGNSAFGARSIESPALAGSAISLALGRHDFLQWLSAITGCGPLSRAEGRVVRTEVEAGGWLDWHGDSDHGRRLGITIHLADCNYTGGAFELRQQGDTALLFSHAEAAMGDTAIFALAPDLVHRVLPLQSGGPRLVYTGWFFGVENG
jgi:hypothetical protein